MRALGAVCCLSLAAASSSGCGCDGTPGGDGGVQCDPLLVRANLPCDAGEAESALRIVRSMSLEEKVQQMSGPAYNPNNMFDQEDNERLGIPGNKFMDGPRGVRWYNSDYGTTVYPVAAARASSWNLELEERIGRAMADEMRDLGRHVLLAPTINQVMHPRWGRAQESYGEDSFLLGAMGSAFIRGAEYDPGGDAYRIQACVKHLAANNIEDTRIYVNAVLDDRTLREVYLPHFEKAVRAGVSCVMASYNRLNGSYNGYSKPLLRDILKTEWRYPGFVITDWFAKGNTTSSPAAGLDIEMPFSSGPFPSQFDSAYFYGSNLVTAVNEERVDEKLVDEAVLRVVYAKVKHGTIAHPAGWAPYLTRSDATQALALESARQSIVLLKNQGGALPLDKAALSKVFVVGKFANSENMGDKGSSDAKVCDSSLVVTPYEGISEALAGGAAAVKTYADVAGHEAELQAADVIVVVAAYFYADLARSSSGEEGEWKDRVSLQLPARDLANISAAVALKGANPALKVVVVMKSGGAIVVNDWAGGVDALLMAWFGGMKEGTALADILFGDVNPSGKLCQSFPVAESDLPPFDNTTTGDVAYGYYHGYRWLDRRGTAPQYAFGFGLSYTRFEYSGLQLSSASMGAGEGVDVSFDVKNAGARAGSEVAQLYVGYPNTAVHDTWGRSVRELKGFARVADLAAGETRRVTVRLEAKDLAYWDGAAMTVEPVAHELWVGPSSAELPLHATFSVVEPSQ